VDVALPLLDDARVKGTVQRIGRESLGPGRLFPVVVQLPEGAGERAIASGMTAVVQLQTEQADTVLVPLGAVLDPAGGAPRVFRVRQVDDQSPESGTGLQPEPRIVAEKVPVVVGQLTADGRVALRRSGDGKVAPLKPGERIVTGGHFALLDRDPIELVTP
jgi:multidrug efflux pump subunit AcrA (membrane-fusion protein)